MQAGSYSIARGPSLAPWTIIADSAVKMFSNRAISGYFSGSLLSRRIGSYIQSFGNASIVNVSVPRIHFSTSIQFEVRLLPELGTTPSVCSTAESIYQTAFIITNDTNAKPDSPDQPFAAFRTYIHVPERAYSSCCSV